MSTTVFPPQARVSFPLFDPRAPLPGVDPFWAALIAWD